MLHAARRSAHKRHTDNTTRAMEEYSFRIRKTSSIQRAPSAAEPDGPGSEQRTFVVAVWYSIGIILVEPIRTLNVAKKSKTAKRGGPARRKKGMKAKKKPASKPAPVPIAPSPPVWEGFGGMKKATPAKKKKKPAPKPAPVPPSPLLKILGEDQ